MRRLDGCKGVGEQGRQEGKNHQGVFLPGGAQKRTEEEPGTDGGEEAKKMKQKTGLYPRVEFHIHDGPNA